MKTCSKCGETKDVVGFSKHAGKRDGLSSNCKVCCKVAITTWRAENPEAKIRGTARGAQWRAANRDKAKLSCDKYRAANPEKRRAVTAKWKAANSDKVKAAIAKYRAANPEKVKARTDKWYAAHPDAARIYRNNRRARTADGKLSPGLISHLFKLQRGRCACGCKQTLGDKYHLDHWVPLALGGANLDGNMRLLLAKCNLSKGAKHPSKWLKRFTE